MPTNTNLPVGLGTTTLANETDVSDEIARAGMGLGQLVLQTGLAVADTQNRLNQTSANTATALATTMVDVIAVEEKVYRDDGTLDHVSVHTRELPLVNFIDPVFYEWSRVRLQGQFFAREFSSSSTDYSYRHRSVDRTEQHGLFIILGGGQTKYAYESDEQTTNTTRDDDFSAGRMRMNSLLRPRRDVTIPRPRQVIQGPRLALIPGEIQDVMVGGAITSRTMSCLVQYTRRDGTPISGKPIAIESEGVPWTFTGGNTTNGDGQLEIQLMRQFIGEAPDTSPIDVAVTARIGLVTNTTVVTF